MEADSPPPLDLQALRQAAGSARAEWPYTRFSVSGEAGAVDLVADYMSAFDPPTALALLDRLEAAEAFLAAKEAAGGGVGWRPIESAPRDGTEIEGLGEYGIEDVCWNDNRYCMIGPPQGARGPGWEGVENGLPAADEMFFWRPKPTHWMPSPEPPALSSGGAG